jgi:phosphoribosylanthranilate isomerase
LFRVKICGVTTLDDARHCVRAGADAIGLNFYPPSPRYVDPAVASQIATSLSGSVARVGVFVNASLADVVAVCDRVGLDFVQLHGDESPEIVRDLAPRAVVKAFRCRQHDDRPVIDFLGRCDALGTRPAAILVDACVPGSYGGTGLVADWDLVFRLQQQAAPVPVILAGGLRPDNVAEAIRAARPFAVDTASGVESAPGRKDPRLVASFVANARRALDLLQ